MRNNPDTGANLPILPSLTPLSKTRRQLYSQLSQAKRRKKEGLFIVEGHKGVIDILTRHAFQPVCIIGIESFWRTSLNDVLSADGITEQLLNIGTPADIKEISSLSTPADVIGVFRIPERKAVIDEKLGKGLYLMLDGVQDPGNLGTIIRTCHWFGVKRIFASKDTVDLYNPKTVQSTMGSLGAVAVEYTDLEALVKNNSHLPLVGLQLEGRNIFTSDLPESAFVCMGSEGNGLSSGLQSLLTESYTIPSADPEDSPESLNVAIATAITLAQFKSSSYKH